MPFQPSATGAAAGGFPGAGTGLLGPDELLYAPVVLKKAQQTTSPAPGADAFARSVAAGTAPGSTGGLQQALGKDVLAKFYTLDDKQLRTLQTRLFNGGFYDSDYYNSRNPTPLAFGVRGDVDSFKAYQRAVTKAAMARAGGADLTLEEAIDSGASGGLAGARGAAGRERAPLTVTLTNPADIRKVADTVARSTLGRALTDQEASSIIAGYQAEERRAQTAAYGVGVGGGTSVAQPSADTFAEQQIRAQHPLEAGGHDTRNAIDAIFELFSKGA